MPFKHWRETFERASKKDGSGDELVEGGRAAKDNTKRGSPVVLKALTDHTLKFYQPPRSGARARRARHRSIPTADKHGGDRSNIRLEHRLETTLYAAQKRLGCRKVLLA